MAKFNDATETTLKNFFNSGDQPTEAQFSQLMAAIQAGIDEHDHTQAAAGDGLKTLGFTAMTGAGVDVPDDWYLGIGAALERAIFDAAGNIRIMGANFGVGCVPAHRVEIESAGDSTYPLKIGFSGAATYMFEIFELTNESYLYMRNAAGTAKVQLGSAGVSFVKSDVADYIFTFFNDGNNANRAGVVIQGGEDANPTAKLFKFNDGNGDAIGWVTGDGAGGVTYHSVSDEKTKNVLGILDPVLAMTALTKVDPIKYVGKGSTAKTGHKNLGFVAQDIHRFFPEIAFHDEETGQYGISYERLVPVLWAQNQALLARIEQLEMGG